MHPKTRKRMIIMLLIVGGLLALIVGFNIFKGKMIADYMASMPVPTQTVTASPAQLASWQPTITAVGTLRAARGADLALDAAGVVESITVSSGDTVEQGQVLLELRNDDVAAALAQAEAGAKLAQVTYDRAKRQVEAKAISEAAFDSAAADLKSTRAAVQHQRALLEKTRLRAPFAGQVGIVDLSPGAYLNAGTTVLTLQQLDPVYVDFTLPQEKLAQLEPGQDVHVRLDSLPKRTFEGELTAVSPKVDRDTRNVRVEARVPNTDHVLVGGMFAEVNIDTGAAEQRLTLPMTAITYNPYGSTVFVIKEETRKNKEGKSETVKIAEQRFVTTGDRRGDQVAILDGIENGDIVVTSGSLKLQNGTPVVIDNSVLPSNDPHPTPTEG